MLGPKSCLDQFTRFINACCSVADFAVVRFMFFVFFLEFPEDTIYWAINFDFFSVIIYINGRQSHRDSGDIKKKSNK